MRFHAATCTGLIRDVSALSLALAVLFCLFGCSRPPVPDVLLITLDTTRFDRLGCTGDPSAQTPVIDALAARGTLFDSAYASVGLTLPAHTTMLTGLEPLEHGVHSNGRFEVDRGHDTLAERLGRSGYATGAFVSAYVLHATHGLNQGFDVYEDETRAAVGALNFSVPTRPGEEVVDSALRWVGDLADDEPMFLWTHFYDPHRPWTHHESYPGLKDAYAADIAYTDHQLGRLLEGLAARRGRPLLVVLTADHGEGLGQHGEETHGLLAYDSVLHVPLILAGPGVERGGRSSVHARHVDLMPTILDAVGVARQDDLRGRNLIAAAAGQDEHRSITDPANEDDVLRHAGYFEARGPHYDHGWAELYGVRAGRWKFTGAPAPEELYDTRRDPKELRNLVTENPDHAERLRAIHDRLVTTLGKGASTNERPGMDLEQLERLAALGYIEAPATFEGEAPDPRRYVTNFHWVDRARNSAEVGMYDAAITTLETLEQSQAIRALVLRTLAPIYLEAGRAEDSVRAYRDYIEQTGSKEAVLGLARALLAAGEYVEAEELLGEIHPPTPQSVANQARALVAQGRDADARVLIDRRLRDPAMQPLRRRIRAELVLHRAPFAEGPHGSSEEELRSLAAEGRDDPVLQSWFGYHQAVYGGAEQRREALALLQGAADTIGNETDEYSADAATLLSNLAWGRYMAGEHKVAHDILAEVLEIDSSRQLDRIRQARVLRDLGQNEDALRLARTPLRRQPSAAWAAEARGMVSELETEIPDNADREEGP